MSKDVLDCFFDKLLNPAFGSLPKTEIEMLILDLMEQTGRITKEEANNPYDLAKKLKISQAKARNLLYNRALREYDEDKLKEKTAKLLSNPKYKSKNDNGWELGINEPLLLEYVKEKIRQLGYISDGSFSPNIIKLQTEAFAALIIDCIGEDEKNKILKKLDKPEAGFKELLIGMLTERAELYVGQTGVALASKVFNLLKSKINPSTKEKI